MGKTGLLHLYTGDGKGKTTAAVGLACRAAGAGMRVLFVQFLKGRDTGELASLAKLGVCVLRTEVKKFSPEMDARERAVCREEQGRCFAQARAAFADYDLVVLDEAFGAVSTGMLDAGELLACVRRRPSGTELVLTGRGAPQAFVDCADYVTEMRGVKHPYTRGVQARRGIEF